MTKIHDYQVEAAYAAFGESAVIFHVQTRDMGIQAVRAALEAALNAKPPQAKTGAMPFKTLPGTIPEIRCIESYSRDGFTHWELSPVVIEEPANLPEVEREIVVTDKMREAGANVKLDHRVSGWTQACRHIGDIYRAMRSLEPLPEVTDEAVGAFQNYVIIPGWEIDHAPDVRGAITAALKVILNPKREKGREGIPERDMLFSRSTGPRIGERSGKDRRCPTMEGALRYFQSGHRDRRALTPPPVPADRRKAAP